MYENLLRLPYFQGMGKKELTAILDKVKLDFTRHKENEVVLTQGVKCDKFVILIQGTLRAEHISNDGRYKLSEEIEAPYAIEPYSLFGSEPNFKRNYFSVGESSMLSIDKSFFYSDFLKQNIFTMNLLNLISRREQLQNRLSWLDTPLTIEGLITRFIAVRCKNLCGKKILSIKMEQLAAQLRETRINVSRALNDMQDRGLVKLSRGEILIPEFEMLVAETWNI